jgi:hypothetical protein
MRTLLGIATGITLLASLLLGEASAEHEADHRYTIRGYVLDENEAALSGLGVVVRIDDRPIGRARTDGQGYYSVRLHLHDEDIGRTLSVLAGKGSATIEVTATPGDQATNRLHYLNFVGANTVEGKLPGWRFPAWVYVATATLIALLAAAYVARRIRRHNRRRGARDTTSDHRRRPTK